MHSRHLQFLPPPHHVFHCRRQIQIHFPLQSINIQASVVLTDRQALRDQLSYINKKHLIKTKADRKPDNLPVKQEKTSNTPLKQKSAPWKTKSFDRVFNPQDTFVRMFNCSFFLKQLIFREMNLNLLLKATTYRPSVHPPMYHTVIVYLPTNLFILFLFN